MVKTKEYLEREDRSYHDLSKFVAMLARNAANPNHWALNEEDLTAEMYLVLAKLLPRYEYKPYDEFLLITRTAMANAVKSQVYKHTMTHRKNELVSYSLDQALSYAGMVVDLDSGDVLGDSIGPYQVRIAFGSTGLWYSPEHYVEQSEILAEKIAQLCGFDLEVLRAILGYNERVAMYIDLMRKRRHFVYLNPTINMGARIIARALCVPIPDVIAAYDRIRGIL